MKTITTSAAALLTMIATAYAGEISGTVASVDPEERTLVLDSGETFTLAEEVSLEGIQPGLPVTVTFEDGTTEATAIQPVG